MTLAALPSMQSTPVQTAKPPRAVGQAKLSLTTDENGTTCLKNLRNAGCMKLVFPRTHGPRMEAILVNTAGGITGGDRLDVDLVIGRDAALTLTTQASERAYRAQTAETGAFSTRAQVAAGGTLHWLPQELILFDQSALTRSLDITLAQDARLVLVEPVVFGRAAMGERLNSTRFHDRISITREGRPLYLDTTKLSGADLLSRPAVSAGVGAMASVVCVRPDADALLPEIRSKLPRTAGASLMGEDTLVVRILAEDSFDLRRSLIPVLERLADAPLPTSWRL